MAGVLELLELPILRKRNIPDTRVAVVGNRVAARTKRAGLCRILWSRYQARSWGGQETEAGAVLPPTYPSPLYNSRLCDGGGETWEQPRGEAGQAAA